MNSLGKHILVELYNCDEALLNNQLELEKIMLDAASIAGASIVGSHFHAYAPHGLSGMVIIKESHIAVHTWPEYAYAAVDFFSCSDQFDHHSAINFLVNKLHSSRFDSRVVERGMKNQLQELKPH